MQAKAQLEQQINTTNQSPSQTADTDPQETAEWLEAWDQILDEDNPQRVTYLLQKLAERARFAGMNIPARFNTPYCNTIPVEEEAPYPGNLEIERRIKSIIRWNAMAMVVRQNKEDPGIGGHIATYASIATLMEVGFNHFFRATINEEPGEAISSTSRATPALASTRALSWKVV
jgi:pyruvate dehydrogenase E1 component